MHKFKDFHKEYYGLDSPDPSPLWYLLVIILTALIYFVFSFELEGMILWAIGFFVITWFFGPIRE